MIATSFDPVRFIPAPWAPDDPAAPVFLLKPGDPIERAWFEAELAGTFAAGTVYDFQLLDAINGGITTLLADDPGRDTLLALVAAEASQQEISATDRQILTQAREVLGEQWPEYRLLLAQRARRKQFLPLVAFRRFCVGWENVVYRGEPLPFGRGPDGLVLLPLIGKIAALHVRLAGLRAFELLYPDLDAEKN